MTQLSRRRAFCEFVFQGKSVKEVCMNYFITQEKFEKELRKETFLIFHDIDERRAIMKINSPMVMMKTDR